MAQSMQFRALTPDQIKQLEAHGCTAADWSKVQVTDKFQAKFCAQAHFSGEVRLADNSGKVKAAFRFFIFCGAYS